LNLSILVFVGCLILAIATAVLVDVVVLRVQLSAWTVLIAVLALEIAAWIALSRYRDRRLKALLDLKDSALW